MGLDECVVHGRRTHPLERKILTRMDLGIISAIDIDNFVSSTQFGERCQYLA